MDFGFLSDEKVVDISGVKISPKDNFNTVIHEFYENAEVCEGWIYPPFERCDVSQLEKRNFKKKFLDKRSDFCPVTATHEISTLTHDEEKERFLILCYGFLFGIYLGQDKSLCINRIPYQPGILTGITPIGSDRTKAVQNFLDFFNNESQENVKSMKTVLHWFLLGQTYRYEWDIFDAQYKVLDGLFKISGLSSRSHAERPIELANSFGIQVPAWANLLNLGGSKKSELSILRNNLTHEAVYANQAIGYEYPETNFKLEFVNFNTILIAKTFGFNSPIYNAPYNDRQNKTWSLM